jgi:AcrR family transcriptional regulator
MRKSDQSADGSLGREMYPQALRRVRTKLPKTSRGTRTRAKILVAAREIFDRRGYSAARITDVVERAGIALGTFYLYFDDKDDVLAALLESVFEDLYVASRAPYLDADDPEDVLRHSIHDYMSVYRANSDLLGTLIEAASVDEQFADLWFQIRGHFLKRVMLNIERAQTAGLAEPMNVVLEASALGGMLEHFCWIWFAMGGERKDGKPLLEQVDFEQMVEVVTKLWIGALFSQPSAAPARIAPRVAADAAA